MKKTLVLILTALCCFQAFCFSTQNKMNIRVDDVLDEVTNAAVRKPNENLKILVASLVKSSDSDTTKVKVLHDWICNNISYDTEAYYGNKATLQDYQSVMKKQRALAAGYSALFMEMCRLADIQAVCIKGYSKGFGFTGKLPAKPDHEWNAVKMGNTWRLIDVTWDAGFIEGKTFVKHYSDEWYLLPAENFIYSHLPEKAEFQYLPDDKIRTKESFVKEPFASGKFFKYGFGFTEKSPEYENIIKGPVTYDFTVSKKDVLTSVQLCKAKNNEIVNNIAWVDRKGSVYSYEFDVPDINGYKGVIYARNASEVNFPDKFSVKQFEGTILPKVSKLVSDKITQDEYAAFKSAFEKVPENNTYYYKEDLFNKEQIALVEKVYKLVAVQSNLMDSILSFDISAADTYGGNGTEAKYPKTYTDYSVTTNTLLVSPRTGALKAGKSYTFELASSDFQNFAIVKNGEWLFFTKDAKTGNYKYTFEVPSDMDKVVVYGTLNGKNYKGLLNYPVEK